MMKSLLLLLTLALLANSDDFAFKRVLVCLQNNSVKCTSWNETTDLSYYADWTSYCFSQNTHVLAEDGPKAMKDLKIGDNIMGLDPESGLPKLSKIIAWLHHDPEALVEYQIIQTNIGQSFEASDYHNIGYVDDGKIDFKFTKDLTSGDTLIGFQAQDIKVSSVSNHEERRGLYSPFTEAGNFFFYGTNFNGNQKDPMILAHVLSQVRDPISQIEKANKFIGLWDVLGLNTDPTSEETYIHPLISSWNFIFGSNWQDQLQKVKYPLEGHHLSHTYSSSSASEQKRRRRNLIKSMGLSISIVQETILF